MENEKAVVVVITLIRKDGHVTRSARQVWADLAQLVVTEAAGVLLPGETLSYEVQDV